MHQPPFRTHGVFPEEVPGAGKTSHDGRVHVLETGPVRGVAVIAEGFGLTMREGIPEEIVLRPYPAGRIQLAVANLPAGQACEVRVEKTFQPFPSWTWTAKEHTHALEMTAPLEDGLAEFWAGPNGRRTVHCGSWSAEVGQGVRAMTYGNAPD